MLHCRAPLEFELFDSLGSSEEFIKTLFYSNQNKAKICDFNVTKVQDEASVFCGQFCIYFIVQRLFNDDLDLTELLNEIFCENVAENEQSVQDFLSQINVY